MESTTEHPLRTKDTFLLVAEWLSPKQIPSLRLVCKTWARFIDEAPWSWELMEPLETAKCWEVALGFPQKGEKYSLLYQLGENRRPSDCTFVCVRECDQVIEIKDIARSGECTLRAELTPAKGKIVLIRQMNNHRFAVGYDTGVIQVWCVASLKLLYTHQAFESAISQVGNTCIHRKIRTRQSGLKVEEVDLLIASNNSGELKCWEVSRFDNNVKLRWSAQGSLPIKEIYTKEEDGLKVVLCDSQKNIFVVKKLSYEDGQQLDESKEITRTLPDHAAELKRVKLYRNGDVLEMEIWKSKFAPRVSASTYKWKGNGLYSDHKLGFFTQAAFDDAKWVNSDAFVLEDSFVYQCRSKRAGGVAQIAYPKRLPVTRVQIEEEEKVLDSTNTL